MPKVEIRSVWLKGVFAGEDHANREPIYGFTLGWTAKDVGFGEITFRSRGERLEYDAETLPRTFVEAVFAKLVQDAKSK